MQTPVKRTAQAAITAGLSLMMVLASSVPAFAQKGKTDTPVVGESSNPEYEDSVSGKSYGDTRLYIISKQDDLTTSEGAKEEQIKVSIPVAIHYVAQMDAENSNAPGILVGPSDNVVKFVNHTGTGAVHVAKIDVDESGDATIVASDASSMANDQISFTMTPVQGQSDETGADFTKQKPTEVASADYSTNSSSTAKYHDGAADDLHNYMTQRDPVDKDAWNIAQKDGALGLNGLTGKIGGFGAITPATDYQAGVIHWTVRAGTRAESDVKDTTLTLRYNANNGNRNMQYSGNDGLLVDQKAVILTYDNDPAVQAFSYDATNTTNTQVGAGLKASSVVTAPKSKTNADGTVTSYAFAGWSLSPDATPSTTAAEGGFFDSNATVADVVAAAKAYYSITETQLGNNVVQLYAIYTATTA